MVQHLEYLRPDSQRLDKSLIYMAKVSVIIPTYNRALLLQEAVKSVLNQSFGDFELIVVDDCSTDGTGETMDRFRQNDPRVIFHALDSNSGMPSLPKNYGIKLAKGEYVAFLDSDDAWERDKLKAQVEFMDENKNCVLLGTGVVVVDDGGKEKYRFLNPAGDKDLRARMLRRNYFVSSSVIVRKSALDSAGEFPLQKIAEDYDLWLRLGTLGEMNNLPQYLVRYRISGGNISTNLSESLEYRKKTIKKYKKDYPGYFPAVARDFFRGLAYRIPFSGRILETYIKVKPH